MLRKQYIEVAYSPRNKLTAIGLQYTSKKIADPWRFHTVILLVCTANVGGDLDALVCSDGLKAGSGESRLQGPGHWLWISLLCDYVNLQTQSLISVFNFKNSHDSTW